MPDRSEAEDLLLQHLRYIERVAEKVCTRGGVRGEDAGDFLSQIKLKLMEDDYAVIRKFRNTSSLTTYLTTVVTRQFVEFQRQRGGRWRVSAAAEREGPPAPELEKLVYRQGYTLHAAGEKLRTSGQTRMSDTELARLLQKLPERDPLRPVQVPSETLDRTVGSQRADERIADAEAGAERARVVAALWQALGTLDKEDRVIAQMRFVDGYTIADVARVLRTEQKPLYRRVDKILHRLRQELEKLGVRGADVDGMFAGEVKD